MEGQFCPAPNPFYAAHNLRPPHGTRTERPQRFRYNRNGVSMEGRLDVLLYCTEAPPGLSVHLGRHAEQTRNNFRKMHGERQLRDRS